MAKAKAPSETLVETAQDNDFSAPEPEQLRPRGEALESDIAAIREARAAARKARGPAIRKRRVTNYHDAERIHNLVKAGHTHLASADEIVDWEEAGLLPDPSHYATGSTATEALNLPPDEGV